MNDVIKMSFFLGFNQSITYLPRTINISEYEAATSDCYLPIHLLYSGTNFEVMVSTNAGLSYDIIIQVHMPTELMPSQLLLLLAEKLQEYV